MQLNAEKCYVMSYTTSKSPMNYQYELMDTVLTRSLTLKDLGILFDNKLEFTSHYSAIIKRAFKMLGFVIRVSRNFRNVDTVMVLYKTLVRSQLEYASVVWSPYLKSHVRAIEKVQRKFTRFLYRKFQYPYQEYEDRLTSLELESLCNRRQLIDLKMLYKIVNGNVVTNCISDFTMRINRKNVRNMNLFGIKKYNTEYCKNSPVPRLMNLYNSLFKSENLFNLPFNIYIKNIASKIKISNL